MAMTKKEKAEMEEMRNRLQILSALRWTEGVKPDLSPKDILDDQPLDTAYISGYTYNAHNGIVSPAWSRRHSHRIGQSVPVSNNSTASQHGLALFSTRLLALKACRHAVELECAKKLEEIDRAIEREVLGQQCPDCGYTEDDARLHADHRLCPGYPFFPGE